MCGILGGSNTAWNYEKALQSIYHRGPDGQKLTRIKEFTLGFSRLAIIDLSNAAMQPMVSGNGHYAIVFNGEIYDYEKIKIQLEQKGYVFCTKSDTEVLLYAFEEWKENMFDHIDGIYAAAVMDIREEKIYLFRDRPGVKPLYYFYDGKNFAFGSELITLCKMLETTETLKIDNTALYDYFNYLYIPEPKSLYQLIFKLEPASFLVYDLKRRRIQKKERYWRVHLNALEGPKASASRLEEKAEQLRFHMDRIIERQVRSDVPVGTFFSGGIDSSIVTAVTGRYLDTLTAYTIGFTDRSYDEYPYAKKIADYNGIKCKVKYFNQYDFLKQKKCMYDMFGEPFADLSMYPTCFVSEFAKQDVTVVLTGDGGDELFGGYSRYLWAGDALANHKAYGLFNDDIGRLMPQYLYSKREKRSALRKKLRIYSDYDDGWHFRKYYHKELPIITRLRYLDFMTYLPGDILTKVDRASMKVSLEARVPLLDKEMIDFAFSLTQNECNPNGELKGLFKYAYKDIIPLKFFERKKAGFMMPHRYVNEKDSIQQILLREFWMNMEKSSEKKSNCVNNYVSL